MLGPDILTAEGAESAEILPRKGTKKGNLTTGYTDTSGIN